MLGDSYALLATLKTRLGITDATDDTALTNALKAASKAIENYTRRQFNDAGSVSARKYYALNRSLLLLDDFNTTTGLVVKIDKDDDGTYETLVAAADYQVEPIGGIRDETTGWPFWRIRMVEGEDFPNTVRPGVEVTAQWGWSAVPQPVHETCLMLAEEVFKTKDSPYGVAGFGEFGSVRVRDNPKIQSMLNPYRKESDRVM